jgi:hypothetical protein
LNVPPDVNDAARPVANLFVFDFGVHFEMLTLPDIFPASFAHMMPLAVVMETEAVAALVSEVVDTEVVADPVVVGLVTPLRVTDSWSPAFTER